MSDYAGSHSVYGLCDCMDSIICTFRDSPKILLVIK